MGRWNPRSSRTFAPTFVAGYTQVPRSFGDGLRRVQGVAGSGYAGGENRSIPPGRPGQPRGLHLADRGAPNWTVLGHLDGTPSPRTVVHGA